MYILVMHCICIVYKFHSDGSDSVRWYTNREPFGCVPDTTCSLCTGHTFAVNVLATVLQSMYWTQFCNLWTGHLSAVYVLEMYLAVSELDIYLQYWTYICSLSTGQISAAYVLNTDLQPGGIGHKDAVSVWDRTPVVHVLDTYLQRWTHIWSLHMYWTHTVSVAYVLNTYLHPMC